MFFCVNLYLFLVPWNQLKLVSYCGGKTYHSIIMLFLSNEEGFCHLLGEGEREGVVVACRDFLLSKTAESNENILSFWKSPTAPERLESFKMISRWCLNCCLFYLSVLEEYLYTYITQRSIMQYSPSFPDVLNMKLRKHYKKTFFILCYSSRSKTNVSLSATLKKTGFSSLKFNRKNFVRKFPITKKEYCRIFMISNPSNFSRVFYSQLKKIKRSL